MAGLAPRRDLDLMAATGLRQRHGLRCKGGRCSCPWEASVYSKADCKKIRKTFDTRAQATEWQEVSRPKVRQGAMRAPTARTFKEAAETWMEGARSGLIRTRSGHPFKPSAIRIYDHQRLEHDRRESWRESSHVGGYKY